MSADGTNTDDTDIDSLFDDAKIEEPDPEEVCLAKQRDAEKRERDAAEERAREEERLREKAKLDRQGIKFAIVATLIVLGLAVTFVYSALQHREKSREPDHAGKNETRHTK